MLIDGSVALVTGTDRALGAAFANALLDRGAAKVYAAASDASSIADQRLIPVRLDVTDCASIEEATKAAPDVSLLINNAGIDTGPPSVALGEEAALRLALEVGYRRPVAVSRAFAPVVGANGGGALVNMLCGLAWFTLPNPGGYSSARAAMWAATNSLREDVVAQRTLVTAVLARYLDTGAAGGADGARTTPEAVAIATLDGVEAGEHEVLIDDFAQQVHSGSSGPLIGLHPSGYS